MSQSPKDSPEVMKFMALFSRLKQWRDDTPEELEECARTDSSVRDLGDAVDLAAAELTFNERRHPGLFTAPVDPACSLRASGQLSPAGSGFQLDERRGSEQFIDTNLLFFEKGAPTRDIWY